MTGAVTAARTTTATASPTAQRSARASTLATPTRTTTGTKDGRENAGKIVKLSDSSITIKLAVGGSMTARLGDGLAVNCGASGPGESTDPDR